MKKFWAEFKEFAIKGNMIDLAVGMIIGGAFTALVNGFMTNIVNPLIGLLTGGVDLDNLWKQIGDLLKDMGFYKDDSQIVSLRLTKFKSCNPGFTLGIEPYHDMSNDVMGYSGSNTDEWPQR